MTMASCVSGIFVLGIVCVALQEGFGLPVSEPLSHIRTKRCSCNSWDDKECIYFCHLDIIWVNTPGKLLPYGLGSPRRRRSADRCECTNPTDGGCRGFCHQRSEDTVKLNRKASNPTTNTFLEAFRSVVQSNMDFTKTSKKNSSRRTKNRTRR